MTKIILPNGEELDIAANCGYCAYFRRLNMDEATEGRCHRYAPRLYSNKHPPGPPFPRVMADDWCGEFKYWNEVFEYCE